MEKKINYNLRLFGLLLFFLYFSYVVVLFGTLVLHINFSNMSDTQLTYVDMVISLGQCLVAWWLYKELLANDLKKLKNKPNFKWVNYLEYIIRGFIIFMCVKIISSYVTIFIGELLHFEDMTTDNQNAIELLTGSAPLIMLFTTVLLAPFTEELIFRGAIGKVIKNKRVFITVSGLIFGLMHITSDLVLLITLLVLGIVISRIWDSKDTKQDKIKRICAFSLSVLIILAGYYTYRYIKLGPAIFIDLKEIIGSITYIAAGVYLAYVYAQSDIIYDSMGIHALNNLFSMIVILFFS